MHNAQNSPDYLRTSQAAAMTLGLKHGRFYRNARLGCINLLLTYNEGCYANCAYCGLSRERPGEYNRKSFIRVEWPRYSLDLIGERIREREHRLGRICISMVTHPKAVDDTITVTRRLKNVTRLPISLLISPTILKKEHLAAFKTAGADRIGIAVDAATPELFDRYRGSGVKGPHRWESYWSCFDDAVEIFGSMMVGSHLITGLGETEREMVGAIALTRRHGGFTHLFSFYPEADSMLADREPPPIGQYRRIQLARYLIDNGLSDPADFRYDDEEHIVHFGLPPNKMDPIIDSGEPFRTSGCPGRDGAVACNRPYANSLPGPDIRNFPFKPDKDDIAKVRRELTYYEAIPV